MRPRPSTRPDLMSSPTPPDPPGAAMPLTPPPLPPPGSQTPVTPPGGPPQPSGSRSSRGGRSPSPFMYAPRGRTLGG
eukprot:8162847-Karenia_brevis.AAC.1